MTLALVGARAALPLATLAIGRVIPLGPKSFLLLFGLKTVLSLVAMIAFLVWSYRALSALRDAGVTAMSPGLGVGGWFIPLANVVLPWRAARSILRGAGSTLPLAGLWWLAWLVSLPLGYHQQQSVLFHLGLSNQPSPLDDLLYDALYDAPEETILTVMESLNWATLVTEVAAWGLMAAMIAQARRAAR